jgi:hypothetical protein
MIKKIISGFVIVLSIVIFSNNSTTLALDLTDVQKNTAEQACKQKGGSIDGDGKCDKGGSDLQGLFTTVTNILLFLVGAIAVIMLVIGGLKYVTSNGDQNAITSAKQTILYAIIGIVVAFLAYAAVNFVITQLMKSS